MAEILKINPPLILNCVQVYLDQLPQRGYPCKSTRELAVTGLTTHPYGASETAASPLRR